MNPIDGTLPAANDHDGMSGAYAERDPVTDAAAARYVRRCARDAADEAELLAALGIEVAA